MYDFGRFRLSYTIDQLWLAVLDHKCVLFCIGKEGLFWLSCVSGESYWVKSEGLGFLEMILKLLGQSYGLVERNMDVTGLSLAYMSLVPIVYCFWYDICCRGSIWNTTEPVIGSDLRVRGTWAWVGHLANWDLLLFQICAIYVWFWYIWAYFSAKCYSKSWKFIYY